MIPLSYGNGFFIYLLIWIVYLTILWIRESWRTNINDWSLSDGKLCVCEDCSYAFIVKPRELSAKCPRCDNLCYIKKIKIKKEL
ncbi:MAG: hypothetical protein GY756_27985 [bacterium]|nr:hypothetical protein [bacterium]HJO93281.1 hypothetical protein [Victivallales bacterium]